MVLSGDLGLLAYYDSNPELGDRFIAAFEQAVADRKILPLARRARRRREMGDRFLSESFTWFG
ncbi:MAG: hypothetical protein U0793_29195 [Gemmataceae bacterium]